MILPEKKETAYFYANIFWYLKKKGTPIPTNDICVAASTMRYGRLFIHDKPFHEGEGQ